MKLSVLIPTYRRAASLRLCLQGLQQQTRPADEVCLVVLQDDAETLALAQSLTGWPPLRLVVSHAGGQVHQLNTGLSAVSGEVVAITDDDAIPRPDWLERIEQHFASSPDLGGVGGRDFVHEHGELLSGNPKNVGIVRWFGRVVGNHHLGTHVQSHVDVLKGANMSYRVAAIRTLRFDTELRGKGAQTCNDMAFSLAVSGAGWRLLFDPDVAVDHYPATRHDADQRSVPSLPAIEDSCYNFYLALRRHMHAGPRKAMALLWAWAIGTPRAPGMLRGIIARARKDSFGVELRATAKRAWAAAKATAASSQVLQA